MKCFIPITSALAGVALLTLGACSSSSYKCKEPWEEFNYYQHATTPEERVKELEEQSEFGACEGEIQ